MLPPEGKKQLTFYVIFVNNLVFLFIIIIIMI